jgi:hypothetical protein
MAIVYVHNRKDTNSIFYVGVGKDEKRAYQKIGRNKHWHNIVKKVGYNIQITHTNLVWEEAISIEKYLIAFYGRKDLNIGNLCNLTDGGEGCSAVIFTDERKRKISEKAKLRIGKYSEEQRRQASERQKIYMNMPHVKERNRQNGILRLSSPEERLKMRDRVKQAMNRDDVKEKVSKSSKLAWDNQERRLAFSLYKKGKKLSEETKMKMSQSRIGEKNPNFGRVFTEEQRLNMSKAHLGKVRIQTEEEKLKRSNTMKQKWARIKFEKQTLCNL